MLKIDKLSGALLAGLLLLAPLASMAATAKMLKVTKSVTVDAPPAAVWDKIKNFDAINTWHPAFVSDELVKGSNNKVGAVRKLTVKDGPNFDEQLLGYNDRGHTMKYKIIDPSPLPITGYVSSISVKPGKDANTSIVTWEGSFKRKKLNDPGADENDEGVTKFVSGVYDGGLGNLKKISETK